SSKCDWSSDVCFSDLLHRGVPVGRAETDEERITGSNGGPTDTDVLQGDAAEQDLKGRVAPHHVVEELLHGQAGVGVRGAHAWVAEQGPQRVADQVRGRLVARVDDQCGLVGDRVVVEYDRVLHTT